MKAKCSIWRYNPAEHVHGRYTEYIVDLDSADTVLDALIKINRELDADLSFRFACGAARCGECAIEVNGTLCLACEKVVEEEMRIGPLPNMPVIKDLVIDRRSVFDKILKCIPQFTPEKENVRLKRLSPQDIDKYVRLTRCLECLICEATCPLNPMERNDFLGPLGFLWLAQIALDPERKPLIRDISRVSLEICLRCGACSEACPCPEDILTLAFNTLENI